MVGCTGDCLLLITYATEEADLLPNCAGQEKQALIRLRGVERDKLR